MGSYSAVDSVHDKTLSGTTADEVSLTGSHKFIRIFNWHASNKLYYRFDGTTAVAAADGVYVVPAASNVLVDISNGASSVSIVGNGNVYSVIGENH